MYKYDKKLKDIKLKDLFFVILYGGMISILLGFVIGFIDYYVTSLIGFSFMMLLFFFSSQYVGNMVRKQYINPHIVYTIITGIFLVAQVVIILVVSNTLASSPESLLVLFDIRLYLFFIPSFFIVLFTSFNINMIFLFLVIIVGVYLGIRKTY